MFMSMSVLGTTVLGTCSYLGRDLIEILPGSQNVHVSHSGAQGTVSAASRLPAQGSPGSAGPKSASIGRNHLYFGSRPG